MATHTDTIYIFWTCRNQPEARTIIHALLEQRLIACASLLPGITSIYRWQGKIEEGQEVKVILKTMATHFDTVQSYIRAHCSYEVPEIVQIDIAQGNPHYLSWVAEETSIDRH
jgi:periplasmic divalent cation tolerance protein